MKKTLSLVLALSMLLCFVACGGSDSTSESEPTATEKYVSENKAAIEADFEGVGESLDISASGNTIIVETIDSYFDDVSGDDIEILQNIMDESMRSTLELLLEEYREDVPELEELTFKILNSNGDLLVTINVK